MSNKEIILKITNDKIYYNPEEYISIQNSNIPSEHLSFRQHSPLYWKAEMLTYETEQCALKLRVSDYDCQLYDSFKNQKPKKEIKIILFEKFDWQQLEVLLTFYQRIRLTEVLCNIDKDPFSYGEKKKAINISQPLAEKSVKSDITITEHFTIPFSDAVFKLGYVAFSKYFSPLSKSLDFKIYNDFIIPEFENIKFWFSKRLKSKKFKAEVKVRLSGDEILDISVNSAEIDRINAALIESVKYQRTYALSKLKSNTEVDKSLFTAEDIFLQFDDENNAGNIFSQSEEDILEYLLEKSNIRNKKQLIYLSGKKQSPRYKLRYTLSPHFGFLFLIEGEKNNHFVWELLNSHATYLWSIAKNEEAFDLQYKRLENIINNIRSSGRETYKRAYRNNQHDEEVIFNVIYHKSINSNLVDNFPMWRVRLEEMLT